MSTSKPHEPGKSEAEHPRSGREKRLRGPFRQERRRIAEWRHGRPFWAGFFILLGALPILYFPYATLQVGDVSVAMSTMAGAAAAVIGCVLILMGLMVWFQPQFRIYAGVTALVCGFISFVTSNLGGFFMGLLSVTIGGSLALAWSYDEDDDEDLAEGRVDGATGTGTGHVPSKEAGQPQEGLGLFAASHESAASHEEAAPPDEAPPGGAGLGEPSAGPATSRPGSTPDALDASARTAGGIAKFGAIAGFPALALVAVLLPMAGPSDPLPPNPFADGPCVSASPSATATTGAPSSTPGTAPAKTPPTTGSPSTPSAAAKSTPTAAGSPSPGTAAEAPAPVPAPATAAAAPPPAAPAGPPAAPAEPTTAPGPVETTRQPGLLGFLDPLLDPLKQLVPPFLRPQEPSTPPPAAPPQAAAADPAPPTTPAPPPAAPTPPTTAKPPASAPAAPKSAPATTRPATTQPKTTPPTGANPSTAPTPTATATATATATGTPTGSKPPYPCPSKVALDADPATPGEPVLPDEPWILKSSLLAMAGMDYKGVVNVTTGSGKTKPVLKFEVSGGVDIWNLDMTSPVDGNGNRIHVFSVDNTKSYMKDGTVTFYTESLKGNLFGLIPIEFTPTSPPPLNVPVAFFTDVTVRQAGQTGATLVIPDLTMRAEKAT